jgi:hypothetical protein
MNIESLQLKRITGNWSTHKSVIPKDGEMILVSLSDKLLTVMGTSVDTSTSPVIVMGNNKDSVEKLLTGECPRVFLSTGLIQEIIKKVATDNGYDQSPTKSDLETTLQVNQNNSNFNCRRIKIGTNEPSGGSLGDIYIKI